MKRLLLLLALSCRLVSLRAADGLDANRWRSVVLWTNESLSANLRYLPKASLADKDCMQLEFNNRSGAGLQIAQAWLDMQGFQDGQPNRQLFSTSGVAYTGEVPPGLTCVKSHLFQAMIATLGEAPTAGLKVAVSIRAEARLADGRVFNTPSGNAKCTFAWRYPTSAEKDSMQRELKDLLVNPAYKFEHGARLEALIKVAEIADSLSLDELLAGLDRRENSVDGRWVIAGAIGRRFAHDPKVVQHYQQAFDQDASDAAIWDLANSPLWNAAWVSPLVSRFERKGDQMVLRLLCAHREDWGGVSNTAVRLSAAIPNFRPLLKRGLATLATNQLYEWSLNLQEAAAIRDPGFINYLRPALDDERSIPVDIMSCALPPARLRVCDAAMNSILIIQDGDIWPAFKRLGIESWHTGTEEIAARDLVIADLRTRLGN